MARRTGEPNEPFSELLAASGWGGEALARRINALAASLGLHTHYTHTSVRNWAYRGMVPKSPVPQLTAQALAERLGRPVTSSDIGMADQQGRSGVAGLEFPRDLTTAVRTATDLWSDVDRRDFLTATSGSSFVIAAYATPVTRWLVAPADPGASHRGSRTIGSRDVAALRDAADEARRWDSKYGGGNWRTAALTRCLREEAAPLLRGTYSDRTGRDLFAATAELCRVAAFSFLDAGHHDRAQRYFIQALRLARAAGNVPLGGYVLATMALQALLRGYPDEAVDMAQGATERTRGLASPRAAAFYQLVEARAQARAGDARAAESALVTAERLLGRATPDDDLGLDYFTHERLAADATEIYRDLRRPQLAIRWNAQARMPAGRFARAVGLRLAIVGTAHLHARQLDEGLAAGHQALDILEHVASARAKGYVRDLLAELEPWQHEPSTREFTHRAARFVAADPAGGLPGA